MKSLFTSLAITAVATWPALAGAWTLEAETSNVTFGSIKNDYVGEAHSFGDISDHVSEAGEVLLELGLASVNTNIDIRNERMIANVFGDAAKASLNATVDPSALDDLAPGESMVIDVEATLDLLGVETPFDLSLFVLRLSSDRVLASTNAPVFLSTEDLKIDAGIDVLQELASLDSITRVTPLTARLIFTR